MNSEKKVKSKGYLCFDVIGIIFSFIDSPEAIQSVFYLSKWISQSFIRMKILSEKEFVFVGFPGSPKAYVKKMKINKIENKPFSQDDGKDDLAISDFENIIRLFPNLKELHCHRRTTCLSPKHLSLLTNLEYYCVKDSRTYERTDEMKKLEEGNDTFGLYMAKVEESIIDNLENNVDFKFDYILMNCGYSSRFIGEDEDKTPIFDLSEFRVRTNGTNFEPGNTRRVNSVTPLTGFKISVSRDIVDPDLMLLKVYCTLTGAELFEGDTGLSEAGVTHHIVPANANPNDEKIREVLNQNPRRTKLVHKEWLYQCSGRKNRLDEAKYLHTFDSDKMKEEEEKEEEELAFRYKVMFIGTPGYIFEEYEKGVKGKIIERISEEGIYVDGVLFGSGLKEEIMLEAREIQNLMYILKSIPAAPHCACFDFFNFYSCSILKIDGKTILVATFDTESG